MSPARRRGPNPQQVKLQRWIDVIVALLRHSRAPVPFETLVEEVPGYWGRRATFRDGKEAGRLQQTGLARMWERDKQELRALGVPIATFADEHGNERLYQLESRDFFLPFLRAADPGQPPRRGEVVRTRAGQWNVGTLAFTPDELDCVVRGVRRVRRLGDPALADAADRALRTLSLDLAVAHPDTDDGATMLVPAIDPAVMRTLGSALADGRAVRVTYHSIGRDVTGDRILEPLALAFLGGHWYCLACDPGSPTVKHFRVSRMQRAALHGKPDAVQPPPGFEASRLAVLRAPWQLGDGDATLVRVRATPEADLERLGGRPVPGRATHRASVERELEVRRLDAFLRWLLTFAGTVRPVAPPDAVARWQTMLDAALTAYESSSTEGA